MTFSGSPMKFFEKTYLLNGSDTFFLHFATEFFVFAYFVVVFIVKRLIVMCYWLPMNKKRSCPHIGLYLSVFIDFRWRLVILMVLWTFYFENSFWTLTNLKLYFANIVVSLSSDRAPIFSTVYKINLVSGFIFYLIALRLQCHWFSYFFNFWIVFLFLVPFGILSLYTFCSPMTNCPQSRIQLVFKRYKRT